MWGKPTAAARPVKCVDRTGPGNLSTAWRVLALCLLFAFAAFSPARAQESSLQAHFGRQIYGLFCSGCHGADGRGDTSITEALDLPAIDLTRIAERNGGRFPASAVAAAISGTSDDSGHKKLAMEPWSRMFADEFDDFAERVVVNQLVARRIDHLVAYLRSIQR